MPATQTTAFKNQGSDGATRSDAVLDRPLPSNLDAEEGLIACCIKDLTGETLSACIAARMGEKSFYQPAHQILFKALEELHEDGAPVDEITLSEHLKKGQLDAVGGLNDIFRLTGRIETTAHGAFWMKIVQEKHVMRALIRTATSIIDRAYSSPPDMEGFLGEIEQEILEINQDKISEGAQLISESIPAAMKMVADWLSKEPSSSVPTGFADLDKLLHGLQPSEMIVLAARPSMGKTSLAMNIAERIVFSPQQNELPNSVLFFSLEMSATQLTHRLLCGRARVDTKRVREGLANKSEQNKLAKTGQELNNVPLWIDDSEATSINEVRAKARRRHNKSPLRLIVIDYLQLVTNPNSPHREQQIAEISRGIKAMAKELDVPILVLSQLNRDSEREKRDPKLSDLRESGSIEQDADVVLLLGRKREDAFGDESGAGGDESDVSPTKVIIAKNRNGGTGAIHLNFHKQFTRFENAKQFGGFDNVG